MVMGLSGDLRNMCTGCCCLRMCGAGYVYDRCPSSVQYTVCVEVGRSPWYLVFDGKMDIHSRFSRRYWRQHPVICVHWQNVFVFGWPFRQDVIPGSAGVNLLRNNFRTKQNENLT